MSFIDIKVMNSASHYPVQANIVSVLVLKCVQCCEMLDKVEWLPVALFYTCVE